MFSPTWCNFLSSFDASYSIKPGTLSLLLLAPLKLYAQSKLVIEMNTRLMTMQDNFDNCCVSRSVGLDDCLEENVLIPVRKFG